ncbi:MAG TPA: RNA polymerase sigma factor [Thermoanaerobaculia bacterium]|nr:RNA polymerase sigma factor [Thermoanaerobaculia bacterium]
MNREELEGELERLHGASYAWSLSCCRGDREEAEDVLQESYLKTLDGRARFAGGSSFKTFLFGVVRRTAAERRRRTWLHGLALAAWSRGPVEAPHSSQGIEARSSCLEGALARLAARQRDVLDLVFAHDMTVEEAARALGISTGSARVHYDRGKKRLRQALGEHQP